MVERHEAYLISGDTDKVYVLATDYDALAAELAGVRSDLAMCEAKGSSLEMRERVKTLEAALREVRTTGVFSVKHTDLWARIDDLMSACPPKETAVKPGHCPKCGEELGADGHHKPDPFPPFI